MRSFMYACEFRFIEYPFLTRARGQESRIIKLLKSLKITKKFAEFIFAIAASHCILRNLFLRFGGKIAKINSAKIYSARIYSRKNYSLEVIFICITSIQHRVISVYNRKNEGHNLPNILDDRFWITVFPVFWRII